MQDVAWAACVHSGTRMETGTVVRQGQTGLHTRLHPSFFPFSPPFLSTTTTPPFPTHLSFMVTDGVGAQNLSAGAYASARGALLYCLRSLLGASRLPPPVPPPAFTLPRRRMFRGGDARRRRAASSAPPPLPATFHTIPACLVMVPACLSPRLRCGFLTTCPHRQQHIAARGLTQHRRVCCNAALVCTPL